MIDYLKRKTVRIESLDEDIEIRQLSAKGQAEIVQAYKDENNRHIAGLVSVKYGVPAWSTLAIEELADGLSMAQLNELNAAISEFSGLDEKNAASTSDTDQNGSSSLN